MTSDYIDSFKKLVYDNRRKLLREHVACQDKFKKMLDDAEIFYVREQDKYQFNPPYMCFMDFYIPYYDLDIELDGKQHRFEDRYDKDLTKESFLWRDSIATLRLNNDEVFSMSEVSISELWSRVPIEKRARIEKNKRAQREGWKLFFQNNQIDIERPIWLYSFENKKKYKFDNIIELQSSIHYDNKKVLSILKGLYKSNIRIAFEKKDLYFNQW